jgi:hypothetical protein
VEVVWMVLMVLWEMLTRNVSMQLNLLHPMVLFLDQLGRHVQQTVIVSMVSVITSFVWNQIKLVLVVEVRLVQEVVNVYFMILPTISFQNVSKQTFSVKPNVSVSQVLQHLIAR